MINNNVGTVLVAALLLFGTVGQAQVLDPSKIQQPSAPKAGVPELLFLADKALESGDHLALRQSLTQLHELRPNNSEYMYQLVLAHALLDEKSEAFNIMMQMQRQGLSYNFDETDASQNLRKTQLYSYMNDLMIRAGKPVGSASVVTTLAPDIIRPEAIAWDAGREAFLLGTVRDGTIIAWSKDGSSQQLFKADDSNGVWGIYDLTVDAERNRLWVISASSKEFSGFDPVDKWRSALFEFDLASMELIKRYPVPVDGLPHKLRNMALSANGDLYVADGVFPIVYVKKADANKLRPLVAFKELVSLRGIDISSDGRMLYVADYEMGILAIEIETGRSMHLAIPNTLNLGGIDGLNYWDGRLVIIQNGFKPQRIMSLELDASGRGVVSVAPLAVALDIFDFPNYGTVVGGELFFFANSHWLSRSDGLRPITIASISLSDVPVIIAPDVDKFMSEYRKAKKEGKVGKGNPELLNASKDAETGRRD